MTRQGPCTVLVPTDEFTAMRGEWFEVDLEVLRSREVEEGGSAAWVDGDLVAPWRSQQTMTSDRCYWKGGIYREPTDSTVVLRMDDLRITAPWRRGGPPRGRRPAT